MKSKTVRSDNTYIISKESTDNPKLGAKLLSDRRESLFLDYYLGYTVKYDESKGKNVNKINRKREYLKLYLWQSPRTPIERQHNKETLQLAKFIRNEKSQLLLNEQKGYGIINNGNTNLLNYFQNFVEKYPERNMIRYALKDFLKFLKEEYPFLQDKLEKRNFTPEMVKNYTKWLGNNHKGQGAHCYYGFFKTIVINAVDNGEIDKNPCKGISVPTNDDILTKQVLSMDEIQTLLNTSFDEEIRRAFAFTCLTGVRWCDVKKMEFANVDFANKRLSFRQGKTYRKSSASGVIIPLNDSILKIIGKKRQDAKDDYIFHIPDLITCERALKKWTKKAGIKKHITWHCGRHSFATNVLNNGANIKVVSSLLGHSTMRCTEKYVRAVDKLKEEAINSMSTLNI